jgi:hypothetical protein
MEVERPERGQERVRVAARLRAAARVRDRELVNEGERPAPDPSGEDAREVDPAQPDRSAPLDESHDSLGARPEGPHDDTPARGMRSEHAVRVVALAGDEPLDVLRDRQPVGPLTVLRKTGNRECGFRSRRDP